MKKYNYVDCHHCEWRLEQVPDHDWVANPCPLCSNTRRIIDPKELLCNMCGEGMCHEIKTLSSTWSTRDPHGLYNAQVVGGYESYHLLDMNRYTFSFCEKCLRQLFMQCKIKPDVDEMNFDDGAAEASWENDQKSYEYRVWKDEGKHHQAYLNRKCNAIKDCPNDAVYTLLHDHTQFTEDSLCEEHKNRKYSNATLVKFISNTLKPFL
jgi:hypothetical protein